MRSREFVAGLLIVVFAAVAFAQGDAAEGKRGPSTADERQKALKLTKELEQKPMAPNAQQDRDWLTKWIIEIPDITVPVCDEVLKPILQSDYGQYKYAQLLVAQELAGSAAYMIEHPSDQENEFAINKAGLDSALNAYQAIVKSGAKAGKWGPLEELLKKRQAGQLEDYVRTATLKCSTGDTLTASLRQPTCAGF